MNHWINLSHLSVFIPMFWVASITPGMCMTLSMSLGMAIGFKRTLWMMLGELVGVSLLAILTAIGIAGLISSHLLFFTLLKSLGVGYLIYIGISMMRSDNRIELAQNNMKQLSATALISQGFLTAVSNPKGWIFFIALVPSALDPDYPLLTQLCALISVIVLIEFSSLCLYAAGGSSMRRFLQEGDHVKWIYRIAGTIIIFVAIWLFIS